MPIRPFKKTKRIYLITLVFKVGFNSFKAIISADYSYFFHNFTSQLNYMPQTKTSLSRIILIFNTIIPLKSVKVKKNLNINTFWVKI